jgi:hypothetical protein
MMIIPARHRPLTSAFHACFEAGQNTNRLSHAKNIFFNSLSKYSELFSGGLGKASGIKPIHLELKSDATPYHIKRAFTIPQCYMETTKNDNISIHG